MRAAHLLTCFVVTGCTSLAGLDGLSFEASGGGSSTTGGGGSSTSSSGMGGAGGGPGGNGGMGGAGGQGGVAPTETVDWSSSLFAVYDFEQEAVLGLGTPGPTLGVIGMVQGGPARSGTQGAYFPSPGDRLYAEGDAFQLAAGSGLTLSAWVKVDATNGGGPAEILASYAASTGFSFDRVEGNRLRCYLGNGADFITAASAMDSFPLGEWMHIGCVHDPDIAELRVYLDGVLADITLSVGSFAGTPGQLAVSSESYPFEGNVDEVVVHDAAVDESAIRRIYACGVSGAMCTCDDNDPTQYVNCGRLHPNCADTLPACNAAAP